MRTGKEWWSFISSIGGRGIKNDNEPGCSPEKTNEVFIGKVETIRKQLENLPKWEPTTIRRKTMTGFHKVTEEDVAKAIRGARNTASSGIDEVPMTMLERLELSSHGDWEAVLYRCY